jgi:hypothetical protein
MKNEVGFENRLVLLIFPTAPVADDRAKPLCGELPRNFDFHFAPKNIDPDTAAIHGWYFVWINGITFKMMDYLWPGVIHPTRDKMGY